MGNIKNIYLFIFVGCIAIPFQFFVREIWESGEILPVFIGEALCIYAFTFLILDTIRNKRK